MQFLIKDNVIQDQEVMLKLIKDIEVIIEFYLAIKNNIIFNTDSLQFEFSSVFYQDEGVQKRYSAHF